ncbi:pilin glycosylation ligase domain-containing protein [Acinetobacter guillouiae]
MTNRPYGNLAQPNQMATILLMGIASVWYVYEKKMKIHLF